MKLALISSQVGKTPKQILYSFIFDEAHRLAERGTSVHVVRAKRDRESCSFDIHFHGLENRVYMGALKSTLENLHMYTPFSLLRKPTTIYWENLYAAKVSQVVEKYGIDLIHAHFAFPEGLVGLLAKNRTKKPLVVTIHGYDILVEPSIRYGARLSKRIDAIISRVLNYADAVIAASQSTFDEACKIVTNIDKVHLVPNGVDLQKFNPALDDSNLREKLGIEGCSVIFALRSHEPTYGLEYLIRAASIVTKEREDVVLLIGGDGSLRRYHERLATKLGVREKILFTGRIPRHGVPFYYAMSDVVVVPSLQEAFGLVVSEAMACAKPVIGTKVGGIPDQIIDRYNGFMVQPRSPAEIAEKILWLVRNPVEARCMGMNGRRIAEEKFDINKRIDMIITLYKSLANRS